MGGFHPQGGIPNPIPAPAPPPPPPSQIPGIVSDIPLQLSKSSRPASRGRDHDFEGGLGESPDPGPGFYSRLFLVEKSSGGWRPVIDLSPFNEFVQQTPFKMGTASSVLLSVRRGDFLASIDLKDAYFQIPVYTSSRKWLRFVSDGTVHQFKVLCFGLSTAPAGLHQSLRDSVGLGPHPGGSSSPVPGRLAGPSLYRGQSQAARPGPSIPVQLPRGSTQ